MTEAAPATAAAYRPIPGPIDRDTFVAAQQRHRRAAAWLSVLAALAVLLVGFPLATILFPLLFGIAALVSLPIGRLLHEPDLVTTLLAGNGVFGVDPTTPAGWLGLGLVVCLPGAIALLVLWRAVQTALTTADLATILVQFGARPPRPDDGEEHQLVNVAEEIAIAAELPAPRVMLLDDPTINVAALGGTPQTAVLLVTRGLLDHCNRDETQALMADAVAVIGNGDLRATLRWIAVSVTLTIVRLLLQAPYFRPARERLVRLRGPLWQRDQCDAAAGAAAFAELLGEQPAAPGDLTGGRIRRALTFPFFITHAMFNAVAWFASLLFLSPALTLLMRRRRYLADAIAVQLTRYPDALASALDRLIRQPRAPRTVPRLLTLLFVAAPPNEFADDDAPLGFFFGTHPSLSKRHRRVARMGLLARGQDPSQLAALAALPPGGRLLVGVLLAVLVPLIGLMIYLLLYLIVALTLLSLVVGMLYVLVVLLPFRWLFSP
jgi:Zn-dependent protease with chaperone function